jgi:hypothetical protein
MHVRKLVITFKTFIHTFYSTMDTKHISFCDITEFLPDECILLYSEGKD